MPPRKRAESKPPTPETSAGDQQGDEALPTETTPPASTDPGDKPKKSDLQTAEQPCATCFPNGWADNAFSHGCEHGTWIRGNA